MKGSLCQISKSLRFFFWLLFSVCEVIFRRFSDFVDFHYLNEEYLRYTNTLLPEKATFWHLIRINLYFNVGSAAFSGRRGWPTFETMTSLKSHTSINSNSKKWIWIHTLAAGSNTIRDITSHVFDVLQSRVKFFFTCVVKQESKFDLHPIYLHST